MIALLLALGLQTAPPTSAGSETPSATVPRIETTIEVDGRLDEPVWSQAARLKNFWQRVPVDVGGGGPATEQSEVLVWYSPQALHFGVIAHDHEPSSIRASMARRDNLDQEDTISFFLDTFNDRRRAFVFTVNPLGAQQDGVQSEGGVGAGGGAGGGGGGGGFDKNPDFRFDSQGRLTEQGYMLEVRIPFKSLRYQGNGPQRWGFNVSRKIQRTGHEDTWTVVRPGASFLAQAGVLDGFRDMDRGVVTEVQPFVTGTSNGALDALSGRFARPPVTGSAGLNGRLGFTNLSVDATLNPDFSQVESDAGLVTINERFQLFLPEKRPFFLDGIELFATPNRLVYTRQIVNPIVGGKVTGKVGNFGLAHLTAIDEKSNGNVLFNITRLRRDFGRNSLAGLTYTDQAGEGTFNRVLAADMRIVFRRLYFIQAQLGRSWSETGNVRTGAPIWNVTYDRTGRLYGFRYELNAVGDQFESRAGYVPRNDFVTGRFSNRVSFDGARGALMENLTFRINPTYLWRYDGFPADAPVEGGETATVQLRLRGGWNMQTELGRSFYRLDADDYAHYAVLRDEELKPFGAVGRLDNLFGTSASVTTPSFQTFNASVELSRGEVPVFLEAAPGRETRVSSALTLRPSTSIRAELSATISRITRQRDGTAFARTTIPRLKIEYQPRRSLFFRVVGEYRSQRQVDLLDPVTADPIYVGGAAGLGQESNRFRIDCLASFEPTPGTAAYFGYGSALSAERTLNFTDLTRTADGFFVKLAYQFRR